MKKILFVFIFLILSITTFAQFRINYSGIKALPTNSLPEYGTWYKIKKQGIVVMNAYYFKQNPVGVMTAMGMIKSILKENNIEYDIYLDDKSLISSLVKDMEDYETLNLTINSGYSIINRIWRKGDEYLEFSLSETGYHIFVAGAK